MGDRQRIRCKSNLYNIATALEMYASDNGGGYPRSLRELGGPYLTELPTCPVTGSDYSETYRMTSHPDEFSFGCLGLHHGEPELSNRFEMGDYSQGYPWYTAPKGFPDL